MNHIPETRERILNASFELFSRYGIKSVTMDDIAKHLSMSKKTIYQFFRDKDEVVHNLIERQFTCDCQEFIHIAETAANVVEEVFSYMKKMQRMFANANPNMFYDMRKYHPRSWDIVSRFRNDYALKSVEDAIEKGKKDGLVREDINAKILARMRIEQIEMGFNPTIFPPDRFAIHEVQLTLTEHFLYGICTLKGHKLINKHKEITEEE